MSTSYHTPIVNGDPRKNDAAIWNDPMGELDDALGLLHSENQALEDTLDGLIINDGTGNAEVIAARTGINYKAGTPPALLEDALEYAAGDTYNVKAYGAVGDGSAFDTLAIQAAIDAASAVGGGVVFFPRGTYKFTAALTVPSNVTLRGVGPASVLDWQGAQNTHAINLGTATDAGVEKLKIQNNTNLSARYAIISSAGCARLFVRDVSITGKVVSAPISSITGSGTLTVTTSTPHGLTTGNTVWLLNTSLAVDLARKTSITVTSGTVFTATGSTPTFSGATTRQENWECGISMAGADCIVERCYVAAGNYVAIRFTPTSTRCQAINNRVSDTIRAFMIEGGGTYDSITHNVANDCAHIFCKVESGSAYNTISNNFILDNSKGIVEATGTIITQGAYTVIESNQMLFSGTTIPAAAIYIHLDATYSTVRDNVIKDFGAVNILLQAGADNVMISGNHATGGTRGVLINQSASQNMMIVGNRFEGQSGYGIYATGASTTASFNLVIMNNLISNAGTNGIYFDGRQTMAVISGNIIFACGAAGIKLHDNTAPCTYIAITANSIFDVDNGTNAAQEDKAHIGLDGGQDHITIVGNVLNDTATGADSIRAVNMTNGTVVGNATSAGVSSFGAGTVTTGNV